MFAAFAFVAIVGLGRLQQFRQRRNVARVGRVPDRDGFFELLLAAGLVEHGPVEIVVTGDRADLLQAARRRFLPGAVLAWQSPERQAPADTEAAPPWHSPLLERRADGFAYVCRRGACLAPVDNTGDLLTALDDAVRMP